VAQRLPSALRTGWCWAGSLRTGWRRTLVRWTAASPTRSPLTGAPRGMAAQAGDCPRSSRRLLHRCGYGPRFGTLSGQPVTGYEHGNVCYMSTSKTPKPGALKGHRVAVVAGFPRPVEIRVGGVKARRAGASSAGSRSRGSRRASCRPAPVPEPSQGPGHDGAQCAAHGTSGHTWTRSRLLSIAVISCTPSIMR
jgi:hypothetical protein